jgi:hypothetical protein
LGKTAGEAHAVNKEAEEIVIEPVCPNRLGKAVT